MLDKTESADYSEETAISFPAKKRKKETANSSSSHNPLTSPAYSGGDAVMAARQVWVQGRSTEWWDSLSDPACPEADFRLAFRMCRSTFNDLCDELSAALTKEDTLSQAAIPVHQRVAVCLWRLATGEPLREVSSRFSLGISTCHNIVLQVCDTLTYVLMPKLIRWEMDSTADAASRFHAVSGIPGIVGAVCTDHVPIGPPKDNVDAYYNHRLSVLNNMASYSVTVQALVDVDGFGWPGGLPDAAVLKRSALHACFEAGQLGDKFRLVGGVSYPLTDWMIVPYKHQNLTWVQYYFNERIAPAHAAARGAFQRLKARWHCLQGRTEPKMKELHNMIGACCVLHNLCERNGEELNADLHPEPSWEEDDVVDAAKERDRIAHELLSNG
ncbi:protein ALP1-like [Triticum aestivum]|uniref:protein ALP1-like n=1 Tax=Triticum aestivum TaxID=4565 RepID=UPI001D01FAF5|nr:protein ALP1-like [Triticum aestivum]